MALPKQLQNKLALPVVGSPMFIVSTPALVIAQCKAGIVGSFPALNARPASLLDEWLAQITEDLGAYSVRNPQPIFTACLPPSATVARISCAFFTSAQPFPFLVSVK